MNEKYFLVPSTFYMRVISNAAVILESFAHLLICSYALNVLLLYQSFLVFPGVLLICAPCNPFTLPYNHCNTTVLMVMVNAAPENTIALCGVSS